jgi:hypothetical protein
METTENKNSGRTKEFLEQEIKDARKDIGRLEDSISKSLSAGNSILIIAGLLSAVLAGKGLGAFGLDVLHQFSLGAVVFILVMLLGKRTALSYPQVSASWVLLYSVGMIFISAAFFVLGFVGNDPVRQCFNDCLIDSREVTIKYETEEQKMSSLIQKVKDEGNSLQRQAMNERAEGSLSGSPGENGVVYKTYTESANSFLAYAAELERKSMDNDKNLKTIGKIIADAQGTLWDKTLDPDDLQRLSEKVEFKLQNLFVNISQNSVLAKETGAQLRSYTENINTKRSDRSNLQLQQSQFQVIEDHKKDLIRFADEIEGWNFIDRLENVKTIKISTPNVYIANLYQIHRYFYLWMIGIMLDIAAPLILYFIIKNFIQKRNDLQEVINKHTLELNALSAA